MAASTSYKADSNFAKELEDELMKFTATHDKVDANLVEKTDVVQKNGDLEVNITESTESTKSWRNKLVPAHYQDTTESSSSFGDSDPDFENVDPSGDSEVTSDCRGDAASALDFEKFRMRKKKLTTHWRSFIQPLRLRCKWIEMQIKKLQSQAQKYDRELEAYNKRKQIQSDNSVMIDGARSVQFSPKIDGSDVFKRKKRRRDEATTNVAAYMSRHYLFSCYENRKILSEGAFMNNESKNPAGKATRKINFDDEIWRNDKLLLSFEPGDGDNSFEHILSEIHSLQSRVGELRSKVGRIMWKNADRLSFADNLNLSFPDDELGMVEGTYTAFQSTGVLVPQTAGTSHGDVPAINGSIDRACFAAYESVQDGVLIGNQRVKEEMIDQRVKEEMIDSHEVKIHQIEGPLVLKDEPGNASPPDLPADDQPPPKIRSIAKITAPRGKRKRGRKKGSVGRRGRRSSG